MSGGKSPSDELKAMWDLHKAGGLTEQEYNKYKASVLAGGAGGDVKGSADNKTGGFSMVVTRAVVRFHLRLLTDVNGPLIAVFADSVAALRVEAAALLKANPSDVKLTVPNGTAGGILLLDTDAGFDEARSVALRPVIAGVKGDPNTTPKRPALHLNMALIRDGDSEANSPQSLSPPDTPNSVGGGSPSSSKRLKAVKQDLTHVTGQRDRRTDRLSGAAMAVDAPLEVAHVFPATNEFRLYAGSRACFTEADLLRFYPGEVGLVDAKGLITRDCKLHVPPMLLPTPNDTRNVISLNASMNWAVESGHLTFTPSIVLSDAVWWQHLSAVAALLPSDLRGLIGQYHHSLIAEFSDDARHRSAYARSFHGHPLLSLANPTEWAAHDLSPDVCDLHRLVLAPYQRSRFPFLMAQKDVLLLRDAALKLGGEPNGSTKCLGPDLEPAAGGVALRVCVSGGGDRNNQCVGGVCVACCRQYFNACTAHRPRTPSPRAGSKRKTTADI